MRRDIGGLWSCEVQEICGKLVSMSVSSHSALWQWTLTGLLVGIGSGWAWREAAPEGAPASVTVEATPSTLSAKASPDFELSLRDALAANRVDDVRKWIVELAKRDGVRALQLVLAWKSKDRAAMLDHALYQAAMNDPERTAKFVFATPELRDNPALITRMFAGITRGSVSKAFSMASTLTAENKDSALRGIGREWARMDWRSALEHGLQMQPNKDRDLFLREAVGIQVERGFGALAEWMQSLPASTRGLLPIDWNRLVLSTPQDFALAMNLMPPTLRDSEFSNLFEWLMKAMDATPANRAWINSLPKGDTRDRAFEAFVLRAAQSDPGSVPQLIQDGASTSSERSRLTSLLAGLRAFDDPQGALAYAAALPDPHGQATARMTAMGVIGLQSPQQGLDALIKAEGEWTQAEMHALAEVYGFADPVAALEAGLRMKNETNRNRWAAISFHHWLESDPAAASSWANELPPGTIRDGAFNSVAESLTISQPQTAIIWAQSITDPKKRFSAMEDVGSYWAYRSLAEWQAWLASSGLDEETRRLLLKSTADESRRFGGTYLLDERMLIYEP